MKWIIETDDPYELRLYMQADRMHSALVEMDEWLRAKENKYTEEFRKKYHQILKEWEVVL